MEDEVRSFWIMRIEWVDDGLTMRPQLQRLSAVTERQWSASTGTPAATAPSAAGAGARLDLMSRARTTAPSPVVYVEPSAGPPFS
jgi:hypothetical protein